MMLSWRRARGVKSYGVVVSLSNRRRILPRVVNHPRLALRGFHRLARGQVSVQIAARRRPIEPSRDREHPGGAPRRQPGERSSIADRAASRTSKRAPTGGAPRQPRGP